MNAISFGKNPTAAPCVPSCTHEGHTQAAAVDSATVPDFVIDPGQDGYLSQLKDYFNRQTSLQYRPDRDVIYFHYDRGGVSQDLHPSIEKKDRLKHMFSLIQNGPMPSNQMEAFQLVYWAFTYVENAVFKGGGPHHNRIMPPDLRTMFDIKGTKNIALLGHKEVIVLGPNGAIAAFKREADVFDPPFKVYNKLVEKPGKNGRHVSMRPSWFQRVMLFLKSLLGI